MKQLKKMSPAKRKRVATLARKTMAAYTQSKSKGRRTRAQALPATQPAKQKARRSLKRLEREVEAILMSLMSSSESDSVRVAAAKALMERINKQQEDKDDSLPDNGEDRQNAVAEARELLDELAALKSARAARKGAVA